MQLKRKINDVWNEPDENCCENPYHDRIREDDSVLNAGGARTDFRGFSMNIYNAKDVATKKTNESTWQFGPRTLVGNMGSDVSGMEPKLRPFLPPRKNPGSLIGSQRKT